MFPVILSENAIMLDIVFLAIGVLAFALFGGYAALLRRA